MNSIIQEAHLTLIAPVFRVWKVSVKHVFGWLQDAADSRDSLVECVWMKVEKSYRQSISEMSAVLTHKQQYLTSLRLWFAIPTLPLTNIPSSRNPHCLFARIITRPLTTHRAYPFSLISASHSFFHSMLSFLQPLRSTFHPIVPVFILCHPNTFITKLKYFELSLCLPF